MTEQGLHWLRTEAIKTRSWFTFPTWYLHAQALKRIIEAREEEAKGYGVTLAEVPAERERRGVL